MPSNNKPAKEILIDTRGQVCPSTLLVTLQNLNLHKTSLKNGETKIKILTDNRHSTATIPNAVMNMGYDVQITKHKGYYEINIGLPLISQENT